MPSASRVALLQASETGMGWEGRGHGQAFPPWLDTQDPDAVRGTRFVRSVDPNLTVGRNRRDGSYMLWGPSVSLGGWVPIAVCQDDNGVAFAAPVPWELIVQGIRRQYDESERGLFAPQRAAARAEAWKDRQRRDSAARTNATLRYAAKAVAGEIRGSGRFDARDLMEGVVCADEGRTKTPPRFRKTYSPGTVTPG